MTKSFEDFEVYKKAVELTKEVFGLLQSKAFDKEYGFKDQMKRAVVSITNNIAEGSEYNNNNQFVRFLKIAKGSTAEVRNMLLLSKKLNLCEAEDVKESYELSIEISQHLSNFIKYLRNNKTKG